MSVDSLAPLAGAQTGRRLLGPGPSLVHSRVYQALQRPLAGHLDPDFLALMDRMQARLRALFCTDNPLTLAIAGTGSAGMEAALVNLVEPGDEVLVCVNGLFGNRMCDIAERIGARLRRIDRPWGQVFQPDEIAAALGRFPAVRVVAIVHAETSTGAHQPLIDIGRICREQERLLVVDAVTSLGGTELEVDGWYIDACYSASQKCLSCPPGLAPLTLGPRAAARLRRRRSKVRSWYLDLGMIHDYWTESRRSYHHTAPVSMNYALDEALKLVLEEGPPARFRRHRLHSRALMTGLQALGCKPFAQEGHRLPMLNAVTIPDGIDDASVRAELRSRYDIEIGGGLGELTGRIWRVGLMGESARRRWVLELLSALEAIFDAAGRSVPSPGASRAASNVYDH